MDFNKVLLIGRLTQDPEVKQTTGGQPVCTITVATSRRWKNQAGELQEKSEFNNVVLWRRLAEIAGQYLKKGSKVHIEGHLETRSWDAKDGTKRYRTEIIGENLIMLDSRPTGGGEAASAPASAAAAPVAAAASGEAPPAFSDDELKIDEIPF